MENTFARCLRLIDQALVLLHAYREAMKCAEKKLEDTLHQVNRGTPSLITPKVFWSTRQRESLESCQSSTTKKNKPRLNLSPLPAFCVPLLQRGRTDSLFTPLKRIAELKILQHIVGFREEGCQVS